MYEFLSLDAKGNQLSTEVQTASPHLTHACPPGEGAHSQPLFVSFSCLGAHPQHSRAPAHRETRRRSGQAPPSAYACGLSPKHLKPHRLRVSARGVHQPAMRCPTRVCPSHLLPQVSNQGYVPHFEATLLGFMQVHTQQGFTDPRR